MELIHWNEEFRIGLPEIDRDHENLIKLINELHGRVQARKERNEVKSFFEQVYEEILAHFAHEEKIMLERHYDAYAAHKADHERLLTEIREIADDFTEGVYDYDPENALGKQIQEWFVQHVRTYDAGLRSLVT